MTKDGPLLLAAFAVASGASFGALLRWWLSYFLNPLFASLPLGTLTANLAGGYLVGLVVAFTTAHPDLSPALRLFLVTGFLGGLTTFSTFSAENVAMLMSGAYGRALLHVLGHVAGSFAMTAAGILTWRLVRGA